MDTMQHLTTLAIQQQRGIAFSARPDAPVLPVVPSTRQRLTAALAAWRAGTAEGVVDRTTRTAAQPLAAC